MLTKTIPTLTVKNKFKNQINFLVDPPEEYERSRRSSMSSLHAQVILAKDEGPTDAQKASGIGNLFELINDVKQELGIQDWSLSLGSLEDVFLNVVKKYRGVNIAKDPSFL